MESIVTKIELLRQWDAVAHQTTEATPAGGHSALLLWHIEPSPVDAGVPREIAEVVAQVLTALGQVAFRWSGEPTWPPHEADTIQAPHRGLLQRACDWFMTSWPTDVVVTRSTSVAVHLFDHGWEDQGQVALVIDPKEGAAASVLGALQTLRDWRSFGMATPVHALIAPSTDGDGVLFTATSPEMLEDIVRCLARRFGGAGIEFQANSS
jgi:hypothetical protein